MVHRENDVVIENMRISNPDGDCIKISSSARVTIKNSVIGPCKGKAVWIYDSAQVSVLDSDFSDVASGVYALDSSGINVTSNTFFDSGHHFVQFDKVSGTGNQIMFNSGENVLATSSAVDLINLFQSHGTASSPILVVGNELKNGGTNGSGSGIMTGDAGGSHQVIKDNVMVNPGQVGIGVAGGQSITVENNKVYSESLSHTNVGIYVWDQYATSCQGHTVRNNEVNWTNRDGTPNPFWTNGNCGEVTGIATNDWQADLGSGLLG